MAQENARNFSKAHSPRDSTPYVANYPTHRTGISPEESTQAYAQWTSYEQDLNLGHYKGPGIAAKMVAEFCPTDRHTKRIIDIACGSGFVAQELQKFGFKQMDGLDPSSYLLEMAREKNVYTNLFCNYVNKSRLPIEDGAYDCCVSSGGMAEGHIPTVGLYEMARIVKSGGLVCIVMREEYLEHVTEYRDSLEATMKEMESSKQWKLESRVVVPRYSFKNSGVVFCFTVC